MKSIEEKAKAYVDNDWIGGIDDPLDIEITYIAGFKESQEFIPIEEEFPPYNEDILIQTHRGSIYFGKMREGNGYADYFKVDESDETIRTKMIKSWRPIFYK